MIKNVKELLIISQLKRAIPIPTTASGGIRATEIAIPGSDSLSFGLIKAKDVAMPAIITTPA